MKKNVLCSKLYLVFILMLAVLCPAGNSFAQEETSEPSVLEQLSMRDPNLLVTTNGGVVTWISGDLTDTVIDDPATADQVFNELLPAFGADENTFFNPEMILEDDSGYRYYTYLQYFNNISINDSVGKLIVDPNGKVVAIEATVTEIDPEEYDFVNIVDEGTALQIVKDALAANDPEHEYIFSESMDMSILRISVDEIEDGRDGVSAKAVYIFYSNNPTYSNTKYDMPYLAHYVTLSGYYGGALPCSNPGSYDALAASQASSIFEGKTADTWTGTITDHEGNTREITVPVMVDEDGIVWLGDLERKIIVMDSMAQVQEKSPSESVLTSEQMETWPNKVLMAYENYIKVWEFYANLGWIGPDGQGIPVAILNDFVDEQGQQVDNAVFLGFDQGFAWFATSELNAYGECLDVIGHEYTHAVTATAMTTSLYINEYGAINEAMSDIMGNIIEMSIKGEIEPQWLLAEDSGDPVRNMSDPHQYQQPEYVGDVYWVPSVNNYSQETDYGGVHTNSSLLNLIAVRLQQEGMTIEQLENLFSGVICGLLPTTGNREMVMLLLFSARISGLEEYIPLIISVCEEQGFGMNSNILARVPEGYGRLVLYIPESEIYDRNTITVTAIHPPNENDIRSLIGDMNISVGQDLPENMDLSELENELENMDLSELENILGSEDILGTFNDIVQRVIKYYMTWPDGQTGLMVVTLPEGDYNLVIALNQQPDENTEDTEDTEASETDEDEEYLNITAGYTGSSWEATPENTVMFHVEANCETWIPNTGLAEALEVQLSAAE